MTVDTTDWLLVSEAILPIKIILFGALMFVTMMFIRDDDNQGGPPAAA